MKTNLNIACFSLAFAMGAAQASAQITNTIFSITNVVRPGGATTANTILVGTSNTVPTTMSVSSSNVVFSAKSGNFVTYFAPQTLSVGDTIKFQYQGTFTNADNSANGFRIGLFNSSTGTIYTTDQGSASTMFNPYLGYASTARITGGSSTGSAFQRGTNGNVQLLSPTAALEIFSSAVPPLLATNGVSYSGYFAATLTNASTLYVEYKFGNQAVQSFLDSSNIVTTFNSFAIQLNNTLSIPSTDTPTIFSMSQMDILYTTAIPEPGSLKLLLLGFMFGGVVFFWRKRSMRNTAS